MEAQNELPRDGKSYLQKRGVPQKASSRIVELKKMGEPEGETPENRGLGTGVNGEAERVLSQTAKSRVPPRKS